MLEPGIHDVLRTKGSDVGLAGGDGQVPGQLPLQGGVLATHPVPGPRGDGVGATLLAPAPVSVVGLGVGQAEVHRDDSVLKTKDFEVRCIFKLMKD